MVGGVGGQVGWGGLGAGEQKIFVVWYPKFSPKNYSYETRDCYYQKMRQKSQET